MVADLADSKDSCKDISGATGCTLENKEPTTIVGKQPSSIEPRRLFIRQFNNLRRMESTDFELIARLD